MKQLLIAAFALAGIFASQQASAHYYDVPSRVSAPQPCGQCAPPAPAPQPCGHCGAQPAPAYQGGYGGYAQPAPAPLPPPPPAGPGPRAASCSLHFRLVGGDVILVSGSSGSGVITCVSVDGRVVAQGDVAIEVTGLGIGLGAYDFTGAIGNLGIFDPADIVGDYWVLEGTAAVGLGVGANVGLKSQATGASLNATIEGGFGIGLGAFGKNWHVWLPRPCRYYY